MKLYTNHADYAILMKRRLQKKELADKAAVNGALPKAPHRRGYSLEAKEICHLLYLTKEQFPDFYLPLLLACTTGCRVSELIALRFCDVDFRKKQLSINGQIGRPVDISGISKDSKIYQKVNPKTHAGIRTIPISDLVLDEIVVARERYLKKFGEHYDDDGKGYLCPSQTGTASSRRLYRRYFKQLKEQMGMPEDFHWHDLRHTFATIMEESRINLKELAVVMGHSSSDLTMKVYVEKKQPVFEGIKGYLDIVGEAAKESIVSRASPYRQNIIEYPGDISVLTRIVRQARSTTMQKDEKFLAAYAKIPYNLS